MKRLMILAALISLTASAIGCGGQSGFRNWCRRNRPMQGCDQCQQYAGMPGDVIYEGVVDEGVVEEIPAGKASTR